MVVDSIQIWCRWQLETELPPRWVKAKFAEAVAQEHWKQQIPFSSDLLQHKQELMWGQFQVKPGFVGSSVPLFLQPFVTNSSIFIYYCGYWWWWILWEFCGAWNGIGGSTVPQNSICLSVSHCLFSFSEGLINWINFPDTLMELSSLRFIP